MMKIIIIVSKVLTRFFLNLSLFLGDISKLGIEIMNKNVFPQNKDDWILLLTKLSFLKPYVSDLRDWPKNNLQKIILNSWANMKAFNL